MLETVVQTVMNEAAKTLTAEMATMAIGGVKHLKDVLARKADQLPVELPSDPEELAALLVPLADGDPRWCDQVAAALASRVRGGFGVPLPLTRPFFDRRELCERVRETDRDVLVFGGQRGSGKTALLAQLSEELASVFPTDRCSLDLDLFRDGDLLRTAEARRHVLRQLGVPEPALVEADLDYQYGRAPLSRRFLLVIDNVLSAEELRLLVPGWPASLILASTRELTTDLRAKYTCEPIDGLDPEDAKALLASRCRTPRTLEKEPKATDALLEQFGYLPHAIEHLGALLSRRVGEEGAVQNLLDDLHAAGIATTAELVANQLATVVAALPATAQRELCALAIDPGPEFDLVVANVLVGGNARASVDKLLDLGLLTGLGNGRYRLPWFTKNFALEFAAREGIDTGGAVDRLLDDQVRLAVAADFDRGHNRLRCYQQPGEVPAWTGKETPLDWLDGNRERLVRLVELACARGRDARAGQLCAALEHLAVGRKRYDDCLRAFEFGVLAAKRLGDRAMLARLYSHQGRAYALLHVFDLAHRALTAASAELAALHEADPRLESSISEFWGRYHEELGDTQVVQDSSAAMASFQQAIERFQYSVSIDQRPDVADRRAFGLHSRMLANVAVKVGFAADALRWLRDTDETRNSSRVFTVRAKAHLMLGDHAAANRDVELAESLARQDGAEQAYHEELADIRAEIAFRTGDIGTARSLWGQLVQERIDAGHPKWAIYQAKLNWLPPLSRR